jgi:TfoX/Sxy family transcriptional regulator of competence genes
VREMGEWKKAPEEAVAFFDSIAPAGPGIERKKMFGYPTLFANGNMYMGLFADRVWLRLAPADLAEFMKLDGTSPFVPVAGHVMKEYGEAPAWLLADEGALQTWIGRSLEYALNMPPKVKKPRKKKGS